ncbi:MAG: ureidoglycolate hydrolase [Sphaerochaeta sp.]|jgi:ureidoglycolate lyase|uniref:ureidoglycolate lyase n=1 Tax=Sphaerochaeta sp. TaxID=1972642 RepID=UPI001D5CA403|nr:ureidoglycolate hydrolase [Sphaerochaeta sp.]MDD3930192.1 ureidoglycolate hydrolase [Sphaerochaeta sp.]NCC14528.1 ureidoglycolate hydrolase [Spirochaetia bacterium]NCC90224.1 ureidoglycolate hydrolase [Spirochaetia bacterium]
MREIPVQSLQWESFHQYGEFSDALHPAGYSLGDFYHDRVLFPVSEGRMVGFSSLVCTKRMEKIIDSAECHSTAAEFILPLDGDVIVHVAPPSQVPVPELTEAFLVPKGTMVMLRIGVWHLAPFAVKEGDTHVLIGLPERIYKTDCMVVAYAEDQKMKVNYTEDAKR